MPRFLRQTGVTLEGRPVFAGVYRLFETTGLPLDLLGQIIWERGGAVDWEATAEEMRSAGVADVRSRLEELARPLGEECLRRVALLLG